MQRKLHRPVIVASTRRFARSFHPLYISFITLGLTSLPVAGITLVPQEALVRPPLQSAGLTSLAAKGAVTFPAIIEDAKLEPRSELRPQIPPETTKPAAPEALKPATAPEVPKPQAATSPAPAPPPPAPSAPAPAPLATSAAPAAPAPTPSDRFEQLRKAADMLIEVNTALGAPRSPYGQIIYDIAGQNCAAFSLNGWIMDGYSR